MTGTRQEINHAIEQALETVGLARRRGLGETPIN